MKPTSDAVQQQQPRNTNISAPLIENFLKLIGRWDAVANDAALRPNRVRKFASFSSFFFSCWPCGLLWSPSRPINGSVGCEKAITKKDEVESQVNLQLGHSMSNQPNKSENVTHPLKILFKAGFLLFSSKTKKISSITYFGITANLQCSFRDKRNWVQGNLKNMDSGFRCSCITYLLYPAALKGEPQTVRPHKMCKKAFSVWDCYQ